MGKRRSQIPQRKRTNRNRRLAKAPAFLETFDGKSIVRGYANWFQVDRICALKELKLLGVSFSANEVQMTRAGEAQRLAELKRRKASRKISSQLLLGISNSSHLTCQPICEDAHLENELPF